MALASSHLHILLSLVSGDRHGYSIMKEAAAISGGDFTLGPGALYLALGKLTDQGLIEEIEERPAPELDDARRRYYRITPVGGAELGAELGRLERIVSYAEVRGLRWNPA